jgi:hypothetical protein
MIQKKQNLPRKSTYAALILALLLAVVAANSSLVLADPCTAQLSYPTTSLEQYYGSTIQVALPISATCSFYTGQLNVVGTAYDTTYNTNLGTANTVLSPTYAANTFSGQLPFNLPSSSGTHTIQFTVSIYSSQSNYPSPYYYTGSLLTTASATFVLGSSYYQTSYQNYPIYPTSPSYPTYPSYPYYPSYSYYTPYNNQYHNSYYYYHNNWYFYNGGYYNYYHNNYCNTSNNNCHHR